MNKETLLSQATKSTTPLSATDSASPHHLIVRQLGRQDYLPVFDAMHTFTDERDENTLDEVWLVEHNPVFTQGQAGKVEHLLNTGNIPVIQSDRGGQVTYHGPGQIVAYFMINLRRKNIGVRELVTHIETIVVNTLKEFGIKSAPRPDAPGVYVGQSKICSLGLRIRKGCSFHGLALNVNMDLSPFLRINPCGYAGMEMIQVKDVGGSDSLETVESILIEKITQQLNYTQVEQITEAIA
ncbi:MAG: lipoyl(octanoyl) transferase LipB [Vibrio sp.]